MDKGLPYTANEEYLLTVDNGYLLAMIEVNEAHLEDENFREGAEVRLGYFIPEARRRRIGRFATENA